MRTPAARRSQQHSVLIGTEPNAVQVLEAVAHLREPDGGGVDTPQVVADRAALMLLDQQVGQALHGRERRVKRVAHAAPRRA